MCHWIAKVPLFLGHSPKFDQWYRQQNSKTVSISSIGLQNYQFQDLCKNKWAPYFNTSCKKLTSVSNSVRKQFSYQSALCTFVVKRILLITMENSFDWKDADCWSSFPNNPKDHNFAIGTVWVKRTKWRRYDFDDNSKIHHAYRNRNEKHIFGC